MAQVKAHEADRALARPDPRHRLVLIYGPDQGLVAERAEMLAKRLVPDTQDPFRVVRLDGGDLASDPSRLIDEANTIGLFGGERLIRVGLTTRSLVLAVEPVLKDPPRDATIIIEGGDLGRTHPLRAAVERSPSALAVPCYPDQGRALDALIDDVMGAASLSLTREVRMALTDRLGADRRLSRQELDKLALYAHGSGSVTLADVDAVVGDASAREIDDIVEAAFVGAIGDADQAYRRMVDAGEDPSVLLGFILRHALMLLSARVAIERHGQSIEEATAAMRAMPPQRRALIGQTLGRWHSETLRQTIAVLHAATAEARLHPRLGSALALRAVWTVARRSGGAADARPVQR